MIETFLISTLAIAVLATIVWAIYFYREVQREIERKSK